jgi:hypothetical protein
VSKNTHIGLVRKLQGERPLVRLMHNWKNNITMDSEEVNLEGTDWLRLEQDRDQCQNLVNI